MRARAMHVAATACGVALSFATAACGSARETKIGDARLADAWGVVDAPDGPTIPVPPGPEAELPAGDIVRLAIDWEVPHHEVFALRERIVAAGKTPVFLVTTRRGKVKAFDLGEPLDDDTAIRLVATVDGKACISPPGVPEAKCVQRGDKKHIERAYTRELVREAVNAYSLKTVRVDADADLMWSDLVRAVDGARTCCGDLEITVGLDPLVQ